MGVMRALGKAVRGTAAALRARPGVFAGVATGIFLLDVFLPPLLLSLVRKSWDYFAFNPWLSKLPGYVVSTEVPLGKKLEFLPNLALFWFMADGPYGAPEWGFTVDVKDILRFVVTGLLFGAFFALWAYRRDQVQRQDWGVRAARQGGFVGALGSVLGLSTSPCSVVGCGAPVLPAVALAFAGLSSGTLALLSQLSRVATTMVLLSVTLGVAYLGWRVSADLPVERRRPSRLPYCPRA